MEAPPGIEVQSWTSSVAGVREVFHAHFVEHAYPPHAHSTWTLFIVDEGAIRYDVAGRRNHAEPGIVSLLPPYVVHDGRPTSARGYRKRVIYLDADVLGEDLIGAAVDRPRVGGAALRRRVSDLHHALLCADDPLEAETRLAFVAERLRLALGQQGPPLLERSRADDVAAQLLDILDGTLTEPLTLSAAAARIGVSPSQAARAFGRTFGIAPHAYVLTRRLELARERIVSGASLADAAAASGFYDQAHLTRRFKRHLGLTPGRFARFVAARPGRHADR